MSNQLNFTDIEYTNRRRKTKREEFLDKMDAWVPWKEWVSIIEPVYFSNERGRPAQPIERMLRMLLMQQWFSLSDEGIEDAIYDSYAMKTFMRIDFLSGEQVPDATTLCKFRKLLCDHGIQKKLFDQIQQLLSRKGLQIKGGTIVDATIISAPESTKNKDHQRDPEMKTTKKNNKYYFGMREHIGVDPVHGFVHSCETTAANEPEIYVAPRLLREDDGVVYGDTGYLGMQKYVTDGVDRVYQITRKEKNFKRMHGDGLAWQLEKPIEKQKSCVRQKVEYVFHVVKDIFGWKKARYKGLHKNNCYAQLILASVNIYKLAHMQGLEKLSTARA